MIAILKAKPLCQTTLIVKKRVNSPIRACQYVLLGLCLPRSKLNEQQFVKYLRIELKTTPSLIGCGEFCGSPKKSNFKGRRRSTRAPLQLSCC